MRPNAVPMIATALVISFASACLAQTPAPPAKPPTPSRVTPPRLRTDAPLPPAPVRAAERARDAGEAFLGDWSPDMDPAATVQVQLLPGGLLRIVSAGRFEAVGFADGTTALALASVPGAPAANGAPARYGLLRIERVNERTLRVQSATDFTSAPTGGETWTRRPLPQAPERIPDTVVAPYSPDELPKLGEYVYVEELPEAVTKVAPVYPDKAREAGIDGQVMVQALVGRDGRVKDVRVVKSIPALDDAAMASVRQWVFKPALSKGNPVAVWVAVPVKFALH